MSEADEAEREAADARPKFVFPTRRGREEEADGEAEEPLVVLCSVPVTDGVGFWGRVEGEGIPWGAWGSGGNSGASGYGLKRVEIFADGYVRAEGLEIAREILARPPDEL